MENPRYSIGDDLYDVSTKKTYQIADIKIKDNEYWYGYIINNNIGWVREEDAIWRNKNYANYMYPPLYKVGDTIRIKANGKYGEIKEVHPSDRRSCISYTTLCRFDKKVGHVGESGIEKIDESLIPSPKFKIGEVVFVPDSTENGTVRAIEQHEGSYRYEVYYNDEASKKRGAFSYFSEKRLVTFDRISTNPKFSLESLNSKKMEDLYYKVGDKVRLKETGQFGEVKYISKDVNGIPKGYSVEFRLDSIRRFYTNKDDIEKIEDYPIGNPKFKLQEVVCIPDSKGGGVIKRIRQYNDTYMYDVVYTYKYNAQVLNATFSEEDLVKFNELFSNKTLISKEMEDKKPIAKCEKPNIPIRSIKSLIEKSVVAPSSNQAEKKAIDFFVHSVHSMGDLYTSSEYCIDEDNLKEFKDQLNILEKMAIEFYKKIRP